MSLPLFHVDAFATKAFAGNPAAVCPLAAWLDDDLLRAVAAENNLSETAYFIPRGDHYELRWFTPRCEVKLCGHATLASAFVVLQVLEPGRNSVRFETRFSGPLTVSRDGDLLAMDFPTLAPWDCAAPPAALIEGLGETPAAVLQIEDNYFAIYESQEEVRLIRPDFRLFEKLHPAGVAITAPGEDADFVSRAQLRHPGRSSDWVHSLLVGAVLGSAAGQNEPARASGLGARRRTLVRNQRGTRDSQRECCAYVAGRVADSEPSLVNQSFAL
jgi:predicted PhzF superfamily epimerase YddE/YHI9